MNRMEALVCGLALLALFGVGRAEGQSLALSSAMVIFPGAGVAQLNAGGVDADGITVSVDPGGSSTSWTLYLRANSAVLSADGKPVAEMLWRLDSTSNWASLATTDQAIASGAGPGTVKIYMRTLLRWSADKPGNYGTDVTYSLTTS